MPFVLLVKCGPESDIIPLNQPLSCVGRSRRACDYALDHPAVSRVHLIVRLVGTRIFVVDNNTRNGTLVNGEQLTSERELVDGDVIEICGTFLEFHADDFTEHEPR